MGLIQTAFGAAGSVLGDQREETEWIRAKRFDFRDLFVYQLKCNRQLSNAIFEEIGGYGDYLFF